VLLLICHVSLLLDNLDSDLKTVDYCSITLWFDGMLLYIFMECLYDQSLYLEFDMK
jgi:hypothetical protein